MADALNLTELTRAMWSTLPSDMFGGITFLLSIAKIAGILVLVYLGFLIIQTVVKIRQALRLKQIQQDIAEIRDNIALLVGKRVKKDKDKKSK
jgi:uncharacterized membrane protein